MLSRKNIFLNLLLGIMMLSLTAYGDSKNSVPEKPTIKTPNTQKSDTKVTLTWQNDVKTAFELAQKEQKIVMVMVEDVRCRWCIKEIAEDSF